jgi:hypothetical protein
VGVVSAMFSTAVSLTAAEVGRWVLLGSFGLGFFVCLRVCFLVCFKFVVFFIWRGSLCVFLALVLPVGKPTWWW